LQEAILRVLLTGAAGLLGGRLASLIAAEHAVTAARHRSAAPEGLPTVALDLLVDGSLDAALEASRPEAVVHCAALADADRCEADPALADRLNARVPFALARACQRLGVRLIALSTDLVLAGDRTFSGEDEPARPCLVYGHSKLAGERAVLAECPGAAIVRVALVQGRGYGGRPTASEAVAWSLAAGQPVRLFVDQHRTPIDPESVAGALLALLAGDERGLFHLGGPERLSRCELGLRLARLLGLPDALIVPVRQAEHTRHMARRPADVSLDCARARTLLGWSPRPLDQGLRESRPRP
jgi:dTDP-4-dehydrorhamnose reductase